MLVIAVATPQAEKFDAERADEQRDRKMDHHRVHTTKPADQSLPKRLVLVRGLLVHAAHVHVVTGDVAATHVHVRGRHRAHAHMAVASVRSVCFRRLGCAVSGRPGTGPKRIVIFVRRCRRAY